ncbi:hypothetical protein NQ317_018441 [Molorchus minor]|uniref:Uncharacterized protein n=1 Tax=Molorchus minor TaxID=1323400 RepID=A0ABQ9JF42_9CUCU|nr:hypothetical protein NQ317_018441 [Molorchus minor]
MMALEVVKMKQGMSYSCKEKTIILNVFKYFRAIHPEKCVTEIVRRTAKATGCSEKSVFQFRKEEASAEGFREPSKTKIRKNININSRFIKYDENVRQAIRNIIYDLKYRNIVPSLGTVLKNIGADEKLPKFSVMTLRRLLMDMGFFYEKEKNSNKSVLVERSDIKKENLPCNTKKIQAASNDPPLQPQRVQQHVAQALPSNNVRNVTQKSTDTKVHTSGHTFFQNNFHLHQNQMYLPSHGQRSLPLSITHNHGAGDSLYISSGIMPPHQIRTVPPHSIKTDVGFMPSHHPHNLILQQ